MRSIAIIGAGQAGLLLALGLLQKGYRVTVVADRTREDILHGPVPAGAVVFDDALSVERALHLNFWDGTAVACEAIHIDIIGPEHQIALSFESALDRPALCIDQRLKSFRWLQEVERCGGQVIVKPATIADLEHYAQTYDLVVVATGKGELGSLFSRDETRSTFDQAQRNVSMVVITGSKRFPNFTRPGVKFNIIPGIGEIFSAPMYAKDEVQGIFLGFEAIPAGPMDRFRPGLEPDAQLALSKEVYKDLLPWDYDAIRDTRLCDHRAQLCGKIVPTVRNSAGRLPSGAVVLGIADAVNVHDPIAAQGANNAAKAARTITRRIVERGDQPFDAQWMAAGFEELWAEARYANLLSDRLLVPPEPHAMGILTAAAQNPAVAHRFINGFTNPVDLHPWFFDPAEANRYLSSLTP
jgi:2-polyprenyl-6-methoxyphenol hydroxylase-like FAD-dependent oxidoreductase